MKGVCHQVAWLYLLLEAKSDRLEKQADKLKTQATRKALAEVQAQLKQYGEHVTVQIFSSMTAIGVEEIRAKLDEWYQQEDDSES